MLTPSKIYAVKTNTAPFREPVKLHNSINPTSKFLLPPQMEYYCAMSSPLTVYGQQIEAFSRQVELVQSRLNRVAWGRFFVVALMIALFWFLKPLGLLYAFAAAAACFALFLRLVVVSVKYKEELQHLRLLLQINRQELEIAAGHYTTLPDAKESLPAVHDYATDLDILGRASLYQYINRTTAEQGHRTLAGWLLAPASVPTILERQEAARELAPQYAWRQQLHAYGLKEKITLQTEAQINNWLLEPRAFGARSWKWIRWIAPGIILSTLGLYLGDVINGSLFYLLVFVFFVLSGLISRKVSAIYSKLDRAVKEIDTLYSVVRWIEDARFTGTLLRQIQQECTADASTASQKIRTLKSILNRLEYRLNPLVFFPLNTFLFWDLQQVLALEEWKEANRKKVGNWFGAMQTTEALCSLAAVGFNHPQWCYPLFATEHGTLKAAAVGHPLIAAGKRVSSSFATTGTGKIALITGSNMAGKSTFLRSIGVNGVLAMMGSAVCAESFLLSPMQMISSMRVTDNLEENTSTFYAELKKLKWIIEQVNKNAPVFLLLDEMLRGTNSLDRHTGSQALIEQLIRHGAVGMVATHDIGLAALQQQYPGSITNYHFDVQVANDELYFDYLLKEGVCQSLNASILMKKIGIELSEP